MNAPAQKVTVLDALWTGCTIWAKLFENDGNQTGEVNSKCYQYKISEYFWNDSDDIIGEDMWFKQDGVICNIQLGTSVVVREKFRDRIISVT